ncbi:PAS domain-containing sensor histidine kinase [Desulfovibrio inopinatus]|uniref:PAS domain-containing sensor histidine kinase n=1 Tax=Desulfovibrio inopinatus TaxID=102109 RepID=UPI00040BE5B4|nr:PAS domain-containing sensor histidine kinase [Desulfovibrio inopinatus]
MITLKIKKIVGLYALFGALWILFSDKLAALFFPTTEMLVFVSTLKGWFFILTTSAMLWILLSRYEQKRDRQDAILRESEKTFRALFEGSSGPISLIQDGRFVECNKATLREFRVQSKEQFMNSNPGDFAPEYQPDGRLSFEAAAEYNATAYREGVCRFEWQCKRYDGTTFFAEVTLVPIWLKGDQLLHASAHDITLRKQAEEAMRRSKEELEREVEKRTVELQRLNTRLQALDKRKSEFLSSASHELRTPLTSVLGFASIVVKRFRRYFLPLVEGDPVLRQRAETLLENVLLIESEGKRLTRLVNDLLDLTKIESGRNDWKFQDVNVVEEMRAAILTVFEEGDDRSRVKFSAMYPHELVIQADSDRIRQVFLNLLSNARKFSGPGEICVSVVRQENMAEVRVQDSGTGIKHDELERVFEPFYQSQTRSSDMVRSQSTGLGLAICRQIIEHYGGAIWVESEFGHGATFIVSLPLEVA